MRDSSTFYHDFIYFLIAGSDTPITLIALGEILAWTIFAIYLKFAHHNRFEKLYLMMGWLIAVATKPLIAVMPMIFHPGSCVLYCLC